MTTRCPLIANWACLKLIVYWKFSGYWQGSSPPSPHNRTCPLLQHVLSSLSKGTPVHMSCPQHESISGILSELERSSPIPNNSRKSPVGATVATLLKPPVGCNVIGSWTKINGGDFKLHTLAKAFSHILNKMSVIQMLWTRSLADLINLIYFIQAIF